MSLHRDAAARLALLLGPAEDEAKEAMRQLHRNVQPLTSAHTDAKRRRYGLLLKVRAIILDAVRNHPQGATREDARAIGNYFLSVADEAFAQGAPCPFRAFHEEEQAEGPADKEQGRVMVALALGTAGPADFDRSIERLVAHRDAIDEQIYALRVTQHQMRQGQGDFPRPYGVAKHMNGSAPRAS